MYSNSHHYYNIIVHQENEKKNVNQKNIHFSDISYLTKYNILIIIELFKKNNTYLKNQQLNQLTQLKLSNVANIKNAAVCMPFVKLQ